jgi:hypothetical protein
MSAMSTLDALYALVGERAVLLPVPFGTKNPGANGWTGWQQTTFERTQEPDYQARLQEAVNRGGNIGVLLGPPSGNLVAIDFDSDTLVESFLALNPRLARTLRTKGERGCQFWLRMNGEYPQRIYLLKNSFGVEVGEWRGGNGQSIIWGVHPHKMAYQIVVNNPAILN